MSFGLDIHWYYSTKTDILKQYILITTHVHCNPLQGKYRFFTGNSLCSISTLTCFGSVQGLKGANFIEIQGNICILYRNIALDSYIHVYVLITGISLLFEKQQHRILEKQGKPYKWNREKLFIKQGNDITKTEKTCC